MLQVANGDEMMLAGDAHEELPQSVFVGARRGRGYRCNRSIEAHLTLAARSRL